MTDNDLDRRDDAIRSLVTIADSLHITAVELVSNTLHYINSTCDHRGAALALGVLVHTWPRANNYAVICQRLLDHFDSTGDLVNE